MKTRPISSNLCQRFAYSNWIFTELRAQSFLMSVLTWSIGCSMRLTDNWINKVWFLFPYFTLKMMNSKYQSFCLWKNRQLHIKSLLNHLFHNCCINRTIFSSCLQIESCKTSSGLVAIRHLSYKPYLRFINAANISKCWKLTIFGRYISFSSGKKYANACLASGLLTSGPYSSVQC